MFTGEADMRSRIYVSMTDPEDPLSAFALYPFELDGRRWRTVEHYFQAMKFSNSELQERIRVVDKATEARSMARRNFWRIRLDWKRLRETVMTRAVYIKCRTYPEVAQSLINTGDYLIIEQSQYDYYWGSGRDGRGRNRYGKILMEVRGRLSKDQLS